MVIIVSSFDVFTILSEPFHRVFFVGAMRGAEQAPVLDCWRNSVFTRAVFSCSAKRCLPYYAHILGGRTSFPSISFFIF